MKIVIFAALVVASMGACPDAFADGLLGTMYAYGVKAVVAAKCETPTGTPAYTKGSVTMNAAADIAKPVAGATATGIMCATGYTAAAGIKYDTAEKNCALTGCAANATPAPTKYCAAASQAAVTDKYAAFEAPKCEAGRSTATTKCTKAKNSGAFWWTCKADGTWDTVKGACVGPAWSTPTRAGCALAKKGDVAAPAKKVVSTCSTGAAEDCTASKPADATCPISVTTADPKCLAATIKAMNDAKKSCSKEEDVAAGATVAGVGAYAKYTWTCTLMNKATGDGVNAGWVKTGGTASPAPLKCGETAGGGGSDGSSAGTLSTLVAFVAAVAYMW